MKYQRLTKEQLEELHQEFITFLATQSITAEEWEDIKEKKPEVAEEEIDIFSDLVWEKVLNKAAYLDNYDPQQLFLFKISETTIDLILVKVNNPDIDITTTEGFQWLKDHLQEEVVEMFTASKPLGEDRNKDVFDLIKQGAQISEGELYSSFRQVIE